MSLFSDSDSQISVHRAGVLLTWKLLVAVGAVALGAYVSSVVAPLSFEIKSLNQHITVERERRERMELRIIQLEKEKEYMKRIISKAHPDLI